MYVPHLKKSASIAWMVLGVPLSTILAIQLHYSAINLGIRAQGAIYATALIIGIVCAWRTWEIQPTVRLVLATAYILVSVVLSIFVAFYVAAFNGDGL